MTELLLETSLQVQLYSVLYKPIGRHGSCFKELIIRFKIRPTTSKERYRTGGEGRWGELRCFCPVGHSRIRPLTPHWFKQLSVRVLIVAVPASPLSQECVPVCSRTWSESKPCSVSSAGLWPRSTSSSTAAEHPLLLKEVSKANLEGQKLDKIFAVHLICCNYTVNNLIITCHVHFFTKFSNRPMTLHKYCVCCEDYVKAHPKDSYFSHDQCKRCNIVLFS